MAMMVIPHTSVQMMATLSHIQQVVTSSKTVMLFHIMPISLPSTTVISTAKSVPLSRP